MPKNCEHDFLTLSCSCCGTDYWCWKCGAVYNEISDEDDEMHHPGTKPEWAT